MFYYFLKHRGVKMHLGTASDDIEIILDLMYNFKLQVYIYCSELLASLYPVKTTSVLQWLSCSKLVIKLLITM